MCTIVCLEGSLLTVYAAQQITIEISIESPLGGKQSGLGVKHNATQYHSVTAIACNTKSAL